MSKNKLQDVKDAEGFVDHTIERLQKSFRITVIATILILAIETIYFVLLTNAIGSGLEAYSFVHVEQHRAKIDEYLFNPARKILPELNKHTNDVTKSLGVIVHHLPDVKFQGKTYNYSNHSNKVAQYAGYWGKINDYIEKKENYTNRIAKAKKMLGHFNEKVPPLTTEKFAEAKKFIKDFNEKVPPLTTEKFAEAKEVIKEFNEKTQDVSDQKFADTKQMIRIFNEKTQDISDQKFEDTKQMIRFFNEKTREISAEKFADTKQMIRLFNKKTQDISDEKFADTKQMIKVFNDRTRGISTEKFADTKQMIRLFNKKTQDISDEKFAEAKQMLDVFNEEAKNTPAKFEEVKQIIGKINEPRDIQGMANLISQKIIGEIDSQGYMISTTASDYIKQNIDALPEWVKKQIPQYGARLRHEANAWIDFYCKAVSDGLGETFDTFLDDNADKIKEFTEKTDDEEILDKLDDVLTEELIAFMKNTSIEEYGTLQEQSERFLKRLKAANELLAPLASKKTEDLTDSERRLRHAVALFVSKMKQ